jgi:hypothetical protein
VLDALGRSRLYLRGTYIVARLAPVELELANAANTDAPALSDWLSGAEPGPRAESVRPAFEEQIAELQREADALVRAATDETARKAQYVKRHRPNARGGKRGSTRPRER